MKKHIKGLLMPQCKTAIRLLIVVLAFKSCSTKTFNKDSFYRIDTWVSTDTKYPEIFLDTLYNKKDSPGMRFFGKKGISLFNQSIEERSDRIEFKDSLGITIGDSIFPAYIINYLTEEMYTISLVYMPKYGIIKMYGHRAPDRCLLRMYVPSSNKYIRLDDVQKQIIGEYPFL